MQSYWYGRSVDLARRFRRCGHGNVAIAFGLAGIVLCGVVGGAVDYSMAVSEKTKLQAALDAAVLGGARAPGDEVPTARRSFHANLSASRGVDVNSQFTFSDNKLIGDAVAQVSTSLLRVVKLDTIEVHAHSAAAIASSNVCILLLDPEDRTAFKANGSGKIDMPECEMHVTSRAKPATWIDSRQIDTKKLCIKGTSGGNLKPLPDSFAEHCTPLTDPFANKLPKPPREFGKDTACVTDMPDPNAREMVFGPGTYCNWPPINGSVDRVVFEPGNYTIKAPLSLNARDVRFGKGTYAFKGAGVTFNGSVHTVEMGAGFYGLSDGARIIFNNQQVTGKGVTIYLADERAAFLTVQGSSKLAVTPPKDGPYKDFLLYEAGGLKRQPHERYNLDGALDIEGLIYLPSRNLHFNGSGKIDSERLTLVLNKLSLDGQIRIKGGAQSLSGANARVYLLK
ncbi:TadE/TadG family type IV pilus assembly protein [Breoghania sp.]|uniref:TadE/TadG family type IV pilus assembly protein n=1 Tax=Breoghania sp. TaxID=2065378 RepID=UPI002AA83C3A|nr:TadE/TadG family type IV pilus assembly protein [Breoghania sp.]